ncbi:MAG: ribonuclease P protein subunit [Thermoplasmatales archaeon]
MNPYLTDMIGANLQILRHTDGTLIGLKGKCVDERKNIIVISTEKGDRVIPKTRGIILVSGKEVSIEKIRLRPEEKMKKARRRWHR